MVRRQHGRCVQPARFFVRRVGLCCAALLLVLTGCGKKASPVAPRQRPLTAVADLKGVLRQDYVKLTWSHNPDNWVATAYVVLRAQQELPQPTCADCPPAFQKTGSILLARSLRKEKHTLDFSQNLAAGFRYSFSVRPVSASGAQGPDSNILVIDVPALSGEGN
jgi:hypothetical protein